MVEFVVDQEASLLPCSLIGGDSGIDGQIMRTTEGHGTVFSGGFPFVDNGHLMCLQSVHSKKSSLSNAEQAILRVNRLYIMPAWPTRNTCRPPPLHYILRLLNLIMLGGITLMLLVAKLMNLPNSTNTVS